MRRSGLAVALAAAVAVAATPSLARTTIPDVQRASGFCKAAERAMRAGNLRRARESLAKALVVMPNFPGAHMGLGHVALMERRFEDALREYREARADYAQVQGAMFNLKVKDYADAQLEIVALQDEIRNQAKLAPNVFRQSKPRERGPAPRADGHPDAPAAGRAARDRSTSTSATRSITSDGATRPSPPGRSACARTTRSGRPIRTSRSATGSRAASRTRAGPSPRRRGAGCARAPISRPTSSAAPPRPRRPSAADLPDRRARAGSRAVVPRRLPDAATRRADLP
jgi:hypothetical protein